MFLHLKKEKRFKWVFTNILPLWMNNRCCITLKLICKRRTTLSHEKYFLIFIWIFFIIFGFVSYFAKYAESSWNIARFLLVKFQTSEKFSKVLFKSETNNISILINEITRIQFMFHLSNWCWIFKIVKSIQVQVKS